MNRNLPEIMSALLAVCTLFCLCANPASATSGDAGSVFSRSSDTKKIALTFDDGPHPRYTETILDLLGEYDIKATFFVVGVNAKNYPDSLIDVIKKGHEIGNHTYSHPHVSGLNTYTLTDEVEKCESTIYGLTDYKTKLFRPPEGAYSKDIVSIAEGMGKQTVIWTVDTMDWAKSPRDEIVENVKANVTFGSIILFHDCTRDGTFTLEALELLLPYLKSQGYEFVTVSELIESVP